MAATAERNKKWGGGAEKKIENSIFISPPPPPNFPFIRYSFSFNVDSFALKKP